MRTTAYLKAIMEVYGKTITCLGPKIEINDIFIFTIIIYIRLPAETTSVVYVEMVV